MFRHIDHLGIVVSDLSAAVALYTGLGYEVGAKAELDDGATRVTFVHPPTPGAALELMQPTAGVGMLGEFLRDQGPGVHHVAFSVEDVNSALAQLKEQGQSCWDEQARSGVGGTQIAYVGERDGVLIQIVQR